MIRKKILVTGGSGFFGYELVKQLAKNNVTVLDNNIKVVLKNLKKIKILRLLIVILEIQKN